jgi:N-acetylglucosamine kinase-like BadF-type ATPase
MILIADSGSTKTHWCLVEGDKVVKELYTLGINPFYQTTDDILADLREKLIPSLASEEITHLSFYGAGCAFEDKKDIVRSALSALFVHASIEIESDLLGAARALFQHQKGIACILGTGSNSCYYDGVNIIQNVSPLGYVLGDEGSGAVLGKLLVADCLKNQLSTELKEKFFTQYGFTPAQILDKVYKQPFPNRFLAQFAPFLLDNLEEPAMFNIVFESFDAFLTRNVMQYQLDEMEVGFVGSIAHHFRDVLEIAAYERNINITKIEQRPMEGLIQFEVGRRTL